MFVKTREIITDAKIAIKLLLSNNGIVEYHCRLFDCDIDDHFELMGNSCAEENKKETSIRNNSVELVNMRPDWWIIWTRFDSD